MKTDDEPITFGRCLLGGLFTGMIASVIAVIFNVIYRGAVNLTSFEVAMPVSAFMVFPLFGLIAGGFYYLFVGHLRRAPLVFAVVLLLIMVGGGLLTMLAWQPTDKGEGQLRDLITGLEVIACVLAAFLIPFFVNHPRLYLTDEDIEGEE